MIAVNGDDLLYAVRVGFGRDVLGHDFTYDDPDYPGDSFCRQGEIGFDGNLQENSGI